jgi:ubiquinone/menaquinone biosynthesis C-methylase UbiE
MGHSDGERERLIEQAAIYARPTRHLFEDAGIGPGMRVLDIGCGVGDVSLLAASIVGAKGSVVGVDNDMRSLAVAQERAHRAGFGQVSFQHGDLRDLNFDRPFDAVVGRFVLMYVGDPVDSVRRLARHVQAGGIVAFAEFQFDGLMRTWPSVPGSLHEKALHWTLQTLRAAGVATSMGAALPSTFRDAGLEPADAYVHCPLAGGPGHVAYSFLAHVLRSLLPLMEAFGVATAEDVGAEDFAQRLSAEAIRHNAIGCCAPVVCAWARRPSAPDHPSDQRLDRSQPTLTTIP